MKRSNVKLRCAAFFAACTALISAPNVLKLGTLKEISTPYVGVYRCEILRVAGIEFPCEDVRLELGSDGELTLYWKSLFGKEQNKVCPYSYNQEKGELTVTYLDGKDERIFKIPMKNGEIVASETLSGKAFFAKFVRK